MLAISHPSFCGIFLYIMFRGARLLFEVTSPRLRFFVLALCLSFVVNAKLVTVNVDDSDSSVIYTGPGWQDDSCTDCMLSSTVNKSKLHGRTYHTNTGMNSSNSLSNATFTFEGTSVTVHTILPGWSLWYLIPDTAMTLQIYMQFYLDGVPIDPAFTRMPAGVGGDGWEYDYQVIAWNKDNLPAGRHELAIECGEMLTLNETTRHGLAILDSFSYSSVNLVLI
jgi:hypothetical protein